MVRTGASFGITRSSFDDVVSDRLGLQTEWANPSAFADHGGLELHRAALPAVKGNSRWELEALGSCNDQKRVESRLVAVSVAKVSARTLISASRPIADMPVRIFDANFAPAS